MKILGLDLGVGSIGWALIEINDKYELVKILRLGSRIVSIAPTESDNFNKGKGETVCSQRTMDRTSRKGLDRYQMRRRALIETLLKIGMIDPENRLFNLSPLETWRLRGNAATPGNRLTLAELGRVLLHLNQRRGYRHAKSDESDSTQKSYVATVNQRYADLKDAGMTAGQFFAGEMEKSMQTSSSGGTVCTFRIKDRVLPRKAYEEEFEQIMKVQREFYPAILTDATIKKLHDIIFYQRPLKSCKRLVNKCEFQKYHFISKHSGKEVIAGPKVAPRTSPLSQVVRLWEAVNNIKLKNFSNKRKKRSQQPSLFDSEERQPRDYRLLQYEYKLNDEERANVFNYLNTHEKMTQTDLLKILGLKTSDGFRWEGSPKNGMEGNKTYTQLRDILGDLKEADERLLRFNIEFEDSDQFDQDTGAVITKVRMISDKGSTHPQYQDEPLYRLWHTVYSSSTREELEKAMEKVFGITDPEIINRLFKIDFVKPGYANRSAKFMRQLLPHLMDGHNYSEASTIVGVNHSDSLTKEENQQRQLKSRLENLAKGELRQPVVEKILNQMINIVNALLAEYGDIDEIRVELARELKQSKDQRAQATADIAKRNRENEGIAQKISEHGLRPSKRNIQKFRLWEETGHRCIYCGKTLNIGEFLGGHGGEIEHIIPRSILFDDSMSNKACSCRECNKEKNNRTAYDYMQGKSEEEFNRYVARIDELFKSKAISKTKRDRLMMSQNEIPTDFLDRDLRQSQYIAKKAREILMEVCRNVNASSGSVTDFLRHLWGYDMILHNLNLERYSKADLVEESTYEHEGQQHTELRIKDWSKRLDHRHHAVDALVIALTRQGYIQRLSNLNTERDNMYAELNRQSDEFKEKFHLLERWAEERPHFPVSEVAEAVNRIAVSIKSEKKLFTPGKRYIYRRGKRILVQDGLTVPRGALHEATVYGKMELPDNGKDLKYAFANPDLIADLRIKEAVLNRLADAGGDVKAAIKGLKKNPLEITVDGKRKEITTVDCIRKVYTTRKELSSLTAAGLERIVDDTIREEALRRFKEINNAGKFKQSLIDDPIMSGGEIKYPVKRVKISCNDKLVAVRRDVNGKPVGYANTGNNHHVAFYEKDGKVEEIVVSAWTGIKRKLYGLPVIITDPDKAWEHLANLTENDDIREIAETMPPMGSSYIRSFKMGDMCLLGLSKEELEDAFERNDMKTLAKHLYRVQKLTLGIYYFRLHTWTSVDAKKENNDISMKALIRISSTKTFTNLNYTPVTIDMLGNIKLK